MPTDPASSRAADGRRRYAVLATMSAPAVPSVPAARGIDCYGIAVVSWTCPACEVRHIEDHEVVSEARAEIVTVDARCCRCGAPMRITGRPPIDTHNQVCSRHIGEGTRGPAW